MITVLYRGGPSNDYGITQGQSGKQLRYSMNLGLLHQEYHFHRLVKNQYYCLTVIVSCFLSLSQFKFSSSQLSLVNCNSPVSCLSPFYCLFVFLSHCLTVFLSFCYMSSCLSSSLFIFSSSKVINKYIVPSVTMESKKCGTYGMVIIGHRSRTKSAYNANK